MAKEFLPEINRKFTVEARGKADWPRARPKNLAEILAREQARVVGRDWTGRVVGD